MKFKVLLISLIICAALGLNYYFLGQNSFICPDFVLKKRGNLKTQGIGTVTDFIFLDNEQIFVALYPEKESAPLQIYTLKENRWKYDEITSSKLPATFHPRQMIKEDVDNDGINEIIIADHGPDIQPFPGHHPILLKKEHGFWTFDKKSSSLGRAFNFNAAVLDIPQSTKMLYLANMASKTSSLYSFIDGEWKDASSSLPHDLAAGTPCIMTALKGDFDLNGVNDLFLGGCDMEKESEIQTHDRILFLVGNRWELYPEKALPSRQISSSWGTVFVKTIKSNDDDYPDLLIATHDYRFHKWKVVIYENNSSPGIFKFKEIVLPLSQETNTEGYVHSLEDFKIDGYRSGIMAEVRSLIRDPSKKEPALVSRLMLQKNNGAFVDASVCLPAKLKDIYPHTIRKLPNDAKTLLLVPTSGEIYTLSSVPSSFL